MPNGKQKYLLPLSFQLQGSEVVGTGLCVADVQNQEPIEIGAVLASHNPELTKEFIENLSGFKDAKLVGFTVENSRIASVKFEATNSISIHEGDVVFVKIEGRNIYYQVLDAETAEESFDKNPRGTHIVEAVQLGVFDPDKGFLKYDWLPLMNTPLFAARGLPLPQNPEKPEEFVVGTVPGTAIEVRASINDIAEYHAAILGVTGTGKTELALDIIRKAISHGHKVFCVDFTGDYRERLKKLGPALLGPSAAQASELEKNFFAVDTGEFGAKKEKEVLKTFVDGLRADTLKQVTAFVEGNDTNLAVLELAEITNTKATLRMTELYLSSIMQWARANRKAHQISHCVGRGPYNYP